MVMRRCLIVAVGAALARSDARRDGRSPRDKLDAVFTALEKGGYSFLSDVEAVRDLLDAGWDANRRTVHGDTLLHMTAKLGNPKVVQLLVDYAGADVDLLDDHEQTPMLIASHRNSSEIVKALLDSSANPNIARPRDGVTPLHMAASWGNVLMVDMLVAHGAEVDAQTLEDATSPGFSPLHQAVSLERKGAVAALTKHGASWDLLNAKGVSPADMGAANGMSRDQFEHSTRSDAQERSSQTFGAVISALGKGDFSVLNDVEVMRDYVDDGLDVNERSGYGRTFLHVTAEHGDPKVVQLLVESYGVDVNILDQHGQTPLLMACRYNRTENVKVLLDSGANPKISNEVGITPLHLASTQVNVMMVDMLVEHGAIVNAQVSFAAEHGDEAGTSPLHLAVKQRYKDAVAALTKHGANWDLQDAKGVSPADMGAANGMSRDQFEHLVEGLEARVDGAAVDDKIQAFTSALNAGDNSVLNDVETVRDVLDAGWDLDHRGESGQTLLHDTAEDGDPKVVQLLVEYGAHVNSQNRRGATPLLVACLENRTEIVKILLDSGADATIASMVGLTPLHVAALHGNVTLIDMLVGAGADLDAQILDGGAIKGKNTDIIIGCSPLHVAIMKENKDTVAALTKHGANWDLKDAAGVSPADVGARNGMSRDQFEHLTRSDAPLDGRLKDKLDAIAPAISKGDYSVLSDVEAVRGLIDAGLAVNARRPDGLTFLHYAAKYGDPKVVKLLLTSGADPDASASGITPLHMTAMREDEAMAENITYMLLDHGADLNAKVSDSPDYKYEPRGDIVGSTPLHIAVDNMNTLVTIALTVRGADWSIKDAKGRTPDSKMGMSKREFLEYVKQALAATQDKNSLVGSWVKRRPSGYATPTAVVIALIVIALTVVYGWKYREWSAARAESELLRGEAAPAPKPKPQRASKKPAKRRDAPRARRRQSPRARDPAPEAKTPEPKPAPAPTRAEPPRLTPRAPTPPPEPAPTRAEPPRPAPVVAPTPPRAETPLPKPVPECKTEESDDEPVAPTIPRGYEAVSRILEAHGESRLLPLFVEQLIDDDALPSLEPADLIDLGVAPMTVLGILGASAATGKAKKLVAQDALDGAAKHQSVLEETLREHRAEIERLRIGRGEIPDHLLCGITLEIMKDPVMAADGHTYEKCAIEQWLATGARTSPTTNEPLASLQLLPNHLAKKAIADELDARRGTAGSR